MRIIGVAQPRYIKVDEEKDVDNMKTSIEYDVDKNIIYLHGTIIDSDGLTFEQIISLLKEPTYCDADGNEIPKEPLETLTIHISSYGGSLIATLSIIAQMEELIKEGVNIVTLAKEKCMSGGCMILLYGCTRLARNFTDIMYRPVLLRPSTGDGFVNIQDLRELTKTSDYYWNIMKDMLKKKTKLTDKEIKDMYKYGEDYRMNVDEALEKGFIDAIM